MLTGIILLCVLGMAVQASFIAVEHRKKYVGAVCLKGTASLIFIVIGVIGMILLNDPSAAVASVIVAFIAMLA